MKLYELLNQQFRSVIAESYLEMNTNEQVTFPYVTYEVDTEYIDENMDGINLDVDIFDDSSSYKKLLQVEAALKSHFNKLRLMTDDLYIMVDYLRSTTVRTGDELVKRRNMQFYAKIVRKEID